MHQSKVSVCVCVCVCLVTCCLLLTTCCFPQVRPAKGWNNPPGHGLHMFLNHFSCSVLVLWFFNVCDPAIGSQLTV